MTNLETVTFRELQAVAHSIAVSKGFWDKPREDGTLIALCHSELSEALEELRQKDVNWDHVAEELADVVIRVLDFAGGRNLDLTRAVVMKMAANMGREHCHGKQF